VDQNRVDQILEGKVEVSAPYYYSILVSELHNYRHTHTHTPDWLLFLDHQNGR